MPQRPKQKKSIKVGSFFSKPLAKDSAYKATHLLKKPLIDRRKQEKDFFSAGKVQKKADKFEMITGITNDSPEIILLSDFMPVYQDDSRLNSVGEIFQAKQDSLLVNASSSITSILNSQFSDEIIAAASANRESIKSFCENFGKNIDEILKKFVLIKSKLNCRRKLDKNDLEELGINFKSSRDIQENPNSDFLPLSIEEILYEKDSNVISSWTNTKAWIQLVLELKESFRNGLPLLLSNSESPPELTSSDYYSPYKIVSPRSSNVRKVNFNKNLPEFPSFFSSLSSDIDKSTSSLLRIFDTKNNSGILTRSVLSETDEIHEAISRLSYLICKEYIFSTKMDQTILSNFGYTFDVRGDQGNYKVWDYLFGQAGSDITDISTSPTGAGNSLISLSQSIEEGNIEVLTFEDSYVKDNIGMSRPAAVISPGTIYFIESSVNTTLNSFDTQRLESYVSRLKSSLSMLEMLKNNLSFKTDVAPYLTTSQKINKNNSITSPKRATSAYSNIKSKAIESVKKEYIKDVTSLYEKLSIGETSEQIKIDSTDVNDALSHPILLLRSIEKNVLAGSNLLKRSFGPALWTGQINEQNKENSSSENGGLSFKGVNAIKKLAADSGQKFSKSLDVSHLLISAGLEDPELLSLLFVYISDDYSSIKKQGNANKNDVSLKGYKEEIAIKINDRLFEVFKSKNISNINFFNNKFAELKTLDIIEALTSEDSSSRKIIDNISKMIYDISNYFEALEKKQSVVNKFFITSDATSGRGRAVFDTSIIPPSLDKRTSYSSVQKTVYISAIFQLCCLLVHSANPERIFYSSGKNTDFFNGATFYVKRVKDAVVKNSRGSVGERKATSNFSSIGQELNSKNLTLQYDEVCVKSETVLANYNRSLIKRFNTIHGFIFSLYKELNSYLEDLKNNSGVFSEFLQEANDLIKDPALVRLLMSEEQFRLTRSKLYDIQERASSSYDSEIKRIIPYFLNLKDKSNIDELLPIEDVHLVSWNLFLKDFLKSQNFRESDGFNKKIISVGIPQKMHRFLNQDASLLTKLKRNKLIKVHLFKIDNLRPDLVYKPLTYLFDLNRYPTRILKNYIDSGFSINESQSIKLNKIPILVANDSLDLKSFSIFNDQEKSFEGYEFLNQNEKNDLIKNHSMNFLMEEYLNYFSGTSFDEQKYSRFDFIKEIINTEFQKFVESTQQNSVESFESPSIESFFAGETFLSNMDAFKSFLASPKKFDRVFHIMFDPDDFDIDKSFVENDILQTKYNIEEIGRASPGTISFETYHVAIESYDESKS